MKPGKTHKTATKRVRVTKSGKLMKRTAGQNHFNTKESGKIMRNKRSDKEVTKSIRRTMHRLIRA